MTQPTPQVTQASPRWWSGALWTGGVIQALGLIIVLAELPGLSGDGRVHGDWRGVAVGAVITWLGFLVFLPGIIGMALHAHGLRGTAEDWMPLRPLAASDAGEPPPRIDLALDRNPFVPHQGDSALIIDVRRACALGATNRAIRRMVETAKRAGSVSDADRALIDEIVQDSHRRPIQPGHR